MDDSLETLLAGCSCVVGMHPDQATEPAVDHAIARGVPVAVVPCCVCWRDSPHRRIVPARKAGQQQEVQVRSYDQFIEFLLQKRVPRGRVQKAELQGFEGRTTVVFWTARDDG